jgi:ERCC4-related helicase
MASPVMRSDASSLGKIEETLDAICRSPTIYRAELRAQVNLPILSHIYYEPTENSLTGFTKTISSLGQAFLDLKLEHDPYFQAQLKENSERSLRRVQKMRLTQKTWCQDQMKSFYATSLKIYHDLGAWAADFYISEIVSRFTTMVDNEDSSLAAWDVSSAERLYLSRALKSVEINCQSNDPSMISDKVTKLLDCILREPYSFSGIIFVQERGVVGCLAHLLQFHPKVCGRFRVGTMVGTSTSVYRTRSIGELIDVEEQKHTISKFRAGSINLVVATSVLEEGCTFSNTKSLLIFEKA